MVISESFQHRRKMLRQSLKPLMLEGGDSCVKVLPDRWAQLRPEQLDPEQFIELTLDIYGPLQAESAATSTNQVAKPPQASAADPLRYTTPSVWRSTRL